MREVIVRRRLAVPPEAAWEALVDVELWPAWGPSVRAARIDGGGTRIGPGSRGSVRTAAGVWLPFVVTGWRQRRRWAWRVAGVPATSHGVVPVAGSADECVAEIGVPAWAAPYAVVCRVALGRLGQVAAASS